jgi:hypothetical protein
LLEERVFARITDDHPLHMRFEHVMQPGCPTALFQ